MALYDVRCKDIARLLSVSPKTLDEIGDRVHSLHPTINPKGTWVRDILVKWNSLVVRENEKFKLSSLGRAFISLPGREGDEVTTEEKVFVLGIIMLDDKQRKVASELITTGSSSSPDDWVVLQTRQVLKELKLL